MTRENAIFIGATGQNVGKTTICLGAISGLLKRYSDIGFIKPVGQQHVKVDDGIMVDKDVVLFKKRFSLPHHWEEMSPVIIPAGYTRRFLDGEFTVDELKKKIVSSFERMVENNSYTVVEGTGHIGVGSIIGLNNAKVASILGLDMVIIVTGGLGSAIDELSLNITMCQEFGVKIRGVIINRVLDEKREMILDYIPKMLAKWGIPLIGAVPFSELLSRPTMNDFEMLFNTDMIAGEEHRFRHFPKTRLIAGSIEAYLEEFDPDELIITPASRLSIIEEVVNNFRKNPGHLSGLILTGRQKITKETLRMILETQIPTLYVPLCSYDAMKMITSLISKTRIEDTVKVDQAIELVENHLAFDKLCGTSTV